MPGDEKQVGLDVVVFGIESILCIAAALCAIVAAIMRRRDPLRMWGVTVVALSGLIVSEVIGAAVLDAREPATVTARAPTRIPETKATPASTRVRRKTDAAGLRAFRTHWAGIVRVSASAFKAHDTAGTYLRSGDAVAASAELKKCQDTASGIVSASSSLPLDINDNADVELLAAVKKIGEGLVDGCQAARSYLDTSAPSDYAAAQSHFAVVVEGLVQSESRARSTYERMGGSGASLLSFKDALR